MRMILVLAAAGLTASCAMAPTEPPASGPQAWRCDADDASSLIGSHIGAVTFPRDANVRNVCTTCSATEDYRPNRLNLRFDEATGIIRSVDCG
ncbi:MAG: hemolysin [Alphaproteobacteria bacterium]|nr:hemolysin [Alphaproteobacteria bacterium]MBU2380035.1 hemolysin [Alphaproteobacteria bacterium]